MKSGDAIKGDTRLCPICGNTTAFAFSSPDQFGCIPGEFSVYRCSGCGTGVTDVAVTDDLLHQMYDSYYDTQNVIRQEAHPLHRRYHATHVRRIAEYSKGRSLLDLGCGSGIFVKAARERGYDARGIDMSPASIECGRKLWNLDITCITIDDYLRNPENREKAEVVTMYSVLEHVTKPHDTLAEVRHLLADGGLLVAEVPNFSSYQARTFGAHWFNLDVPRHLFHYSTEGLRRVVEDAGFEVIAVRPGPAAIDFGIAASLMPMPKSGETLIHKVIRKLVVTPFGRMLVPIEHLMGSAGSLEVYARKK
jgi:2-polyprenyl-3-methyl-5-hydroxy-6-metoxy-1,4-benzoquinol methylase